MKGRNAFYQLLLSRDRESFYSRYRYNITPVTDDRPFFYKYYKWKNLSISAEGFGGQIGANLPMGKIVILAVLLQSALLAVILILLPLYLLERSGLGKKGRGRVLVYFACLGVGFMFLEITVIQKFILFLGHHTYSISVVLFSILLGCGLGSLVSSRKRLASRQLLTIAITGITLLTLFHILVIPHLFETLLGIQHNLRIALSVVFLVPLGLFMGIPFPVGLRAVGRTNPQMVAWAWGINGCLSVIGSILSVLVSMRFGFDFVMIFAIVVYFIAFLNMSSYLKIPGPSV